MTKFTITLDQAIAELKAELAIRSTAYKKWIRDGRMRQETADKKFAAMRAALHSLMEIKEGMDDEPLGLMGCTPGECCKQIGRVREEEGLSPD